MRPWMPNLRRSGRPNSPRELVMQPRIPVAIS